MDEIDGGNCGGHSNGSPIAPCLVLASPWRVSGGVPQCSDIEVLKVLTSSHRKSLESWDEVLMASASMDFALQTGGKWQARREGISGVGCNHCNGWSCSSLDSSSCRLLCLCSSGAIP